MKEDNSQQEKKRIRLIAQHLTADDIIKKLSLVVEEKQIELLELLTHLTIYLAYEDSEDERKQAQAEISYDYLCIKADVLFDTLHNRG